MMRIISLCPEHSSEILRSDFFERFNATVQLLITCPDGSVRRNTGLLITHIVLVNMNYFDLEVHTNFDLENPLIEAEQGEEFFEDANSVLMYFLGRLLALMLPVNQKNQPYKKLEGYFRIWYTLAKNNKQICEWMLRAGCVRFFLGRRVLSRLLYE